MLTTINVLDYGAKGDAKIDGSGEGTDDTVAFRNAFEALQDSHGGRLVIPPRKYILSGPISFDVGQGTSIQDFEISAVGALLQVNVPSNPYDLFFFSNASRLLWNGGTFLGWNGRMPIQNGDVPNPMNSLFRASTLTLTNISVQGLVINQNVANTAVVSVHNLKINNSLFSSIINGARPVINQPDGWAVSEFDNMIIQDFVSYKNMNGSLGSGGGLGVKIGAPSIESGESVYGPGRVRFHNCTFDEGNGGVQIGKDSNTILVANFTQPNSYFQGIGGYLVTVQVVTTSWMRFGEIIQMPIGGYYQVNAVVDATHVTLLNLGTAGINAAPGVTVSAAGSPRISGAYVQNVEIEGCKMNVTPNSNWIGYVFNNIRNVQMKDCWMREGNVGSKCIKARNVDVLTVECTNTRIDDGSALTGVDIDSTVGMAKFIDSHMDASQSNARQTIVEKNGGRNFPKYTTVGRPDASTVQIGTGYYDTTLHYPLFSDSTNWRDGAGRVV